MRDVPLSALISQTSFLFSSFLFFHFSFLFSFLLWTTASRIEEFSFFFSIPRMSLSPFLFRCVSHALSFFSFLPFNCLLHLSPSRKLKSESSFSTSVPWEIRFPPVGNKSTSQFFVSRWEGKKEPWKKKFSERDERMQKWNWFSVAWRVFFCMI